MTEGIFCSQCGHHNAIADNFCSACGSRLASMGGDDDLTLTLHPPTSEGEPGDEDVQITLGSDRPPVLILERGSEAGLTFALSRSETTTGRHPGCDVFLDDVTVSRQHATISSTEAGYVIRDDGSLNGTYVNNERISSHLLHSGDELFIGKFRLLFLDAGDRRRSDR